MSLKILEFDTQNNHYVFDGITGDVFAVDDILRDCIVLSDNMEKDQVEKELQRKYFDEKKIKTALAFVEKMKVKGLFYKTEEESKKYENSIHFKNDDVKMLLQSGYMQQLILNVTEDCNMRCKYCYLSETYHYTRNRTTQMMSNETARKAMDLFFAYMKDFSQFNPGKQCAISFYGGEPLLNFEVIKYAIGYAKEKAPVGCMFNITTNGLLLNDEIVDFLIENNVAISLSLDGTKENHDRNRVDAGDQGTFDRIMRNMEQLKERHPEYFKINVSFVYDYRTDLLKNDKFFKEYEYLFPLMGNIAFVSTNGTDYFQRFTEEDVRRFTENYLQFRQKYVDGKITGENLSSFIDNFFCMQLLSILTKLGIADKRLQILPFTSPCVPGVKLSVRTNGTIDMCEKINGTMPIGNIETGLDVKRISEIIKTYNQTIAKDCVNCPINKHCSLCYALCCQDGKFNKPNCEEIRLTFKINLMIVYTILELNPHAFDTFRYVDEWILNA